MEKMEELCEKVATLKTRVAELEGEAKRLKAEYAVLEEKVCDRFMEEGITSTKVAGLGSFSMQTRRFFSIKKEVADDVVAAFKEHYPDLVKETVNGQTLSAFCREMEDNETFDTLSDTIKNGLNRNARRVISYRR